MKPHKIQQSFIGNKETTKEAIINFPGFYFFSLNDPPLIEIMDGEFVLAGVTTSDDQESCEIERVHKGSYLRLENHLVKLG
ncbi:MAG: hypothetical protein ACFFC6_14435 [Promethearchaeota archaeon]